MLYPLRDIEGTQPDGWVQGWPEDKCICRSRQPSKRAILLRSSFLSKCVWRGCWKTALSIRKPSRMMHHGDERGRPVQSEVYIWLCKSARK